jgi:hypothetical protein
MNKREALLAFIGASADPIDPIRIMKGMFLFAHESDQSKGIRYKFVPYSYGPCSFEIYDDLNALARASLIQSIPGETRWPQYKVTDYGLDEIKKHVVRDVRDAVKQYRKFVDKRDFTTLLKDVYKKYPDFASKSVFKG